MSAPRLRAAWREMTRDAGPDDVIAVIAHGWVILVLLAMLRLHRRWRVVSTDVSNCGVSEVRKVP